jgi:hypothetical protein
VTRLPYVLLWLLAIGISGCGENSSPEPVVNWGVVDTSLPAEQQAYQDALMRLFTTLQSGVPPEQIGYTHPDLEFAETVEQFHGEGIHLAGWDWNGPPQKNKLPVRLEITLDEPPGDKTVTYERVYQVQRTAKGFVVRRARQ